MNEQGGKNEDENEDFILNRIDQLYELSVEKVLSEYRIPKPLVDVESK